MKKRSHLYCVPLARLSNFQAPQFRTITNAEPMTPTFDLATTAVLVAATATALVKREAGSPGFVRFSLRGQYGDQDIPLAFVTVPAAGATPAFERLMVAATTQLIADLNNAPPVAAGLTLVP